MIDTFALALTHGLMLIAAWRLVSRPDLDREEDGTPTKARGHKATLGAAPDA